jgi:hypothetical protein
MMHHLVSRSKPHYHCLPAAAAAAAAKKIDLHLMKDLDSWDGRLAVAAVAVAEEAEQMLIDLVSEVGR